VSQPDSATEHDPPERPGESPDATPTAPYDDFPVDAPYGDGENAVGATPPGFEWPTHGGYLGCLIGCLASFLIGGFLGSALLGTLYVVGGGSALILALVSVIVYAAIVYGLCRMGWSLGKRYYRSYQGPAETTWGEHDEFIYPDQDTPDDSASDAQGDAAEMDNATVIGDHIPAAEENMRA
jgi:hypothetical protein